MSQAVWHRSSVAPYCEEPGAALQELNTVVVVTEAVVVMVLVVVLRVVVEAVVASVQVVVGVVPPGTPKMH